LTSFSVIITGRQRMTNGCSDSAARSVTFVVRHSLVQQKSSES